jgi:inosine/xanthosine triphosphate pyrophosphatase family protein
MKTVIPGTVSSRYIAVLKEHQSEFLREITEKEEETQFRQAAYDAWVASCFKRANTGQGET